MNGTGQTAKQIFVELIASVPAEQWDQRLVEACSGDHDLQRRVQALLRAHRNPDSFMRSRHFRLIWTGPSINRLSGPET
jgi:hypothetical protein